MSEMVCIMFGAAFIFRLTNDWWAVKAEHVAAKLKCYTNASDLYDVYVTGMFSLIDCCISNNDNNNTNENWNVRPMNVELSTANFVEF